MPISTDTQTTLADIKQAMLAFATERDWLQFHNPKNLAMSIAIEAAEIMEHFQWTASHQSAELLNDPATLQAIREELADVMLFLAEFATATNIDLASTVKDKLAINARKYPVEKSRGVATKYDKL